MKTTIYELEELKKHNLKIKKDVREINIRHKNQIRQRYYCEICHTRCYIITIKEKNFQRIYCPSCEKVIYKGKIAF